MCSLSARGFLVPLWIAVPASLEFSFFSVSCQLSHFAFSLIHVWAVTDLCYCLYVCMCEQLSEGGGGTGAGAR